MHSVRRVGQIQVRPKYAGSISRRYSHVASPYGALGEGHPDSLLVSPPSRPASHTPVPSSYVFNSSAPSSTPEPPPGEDTHLPDQEWEIRTGRAIYVLQQTLPDFFERGLVSSLEIPIVGHDAGGGQGKAKEGKEDPDVVCIYSPKVRLAYRPPVALPPPLPRVLHVEGLQLYLASSALVRHMLKTLYTDLHVELRQVRVQGPKNGSPNASAPVPPGTAPSETEKPRSLREKSLFVGLAVSGVARVSGARGGWTVNSTYHFSPTTGLINLHTIDSIEPAPHVSVVDAFRAALAKLGIGPEGRASPGAGAARTQGAREGGV
ncbi:uncharacterized protein LAESUDRAFT_709012 [Laetiporus sulphureus 93-53]|uniref:Uncharacterized protein n=1 Tax=Laetiporus sulphureus 93-53 TaxID=1314785 RepID=A0A165B699_9APHY|nr:uncharacterized protein LAESUDRAFT_709012 [Laetiporus sulphureus 93-53]KZT00337.1 hypothetical protein LAESUDRAFT_709012 [Laetiporus sulphureus 93-53]